MDFNWAHSPGFYTPSHRTSPLTIQSKWYPSCFMIKTQAGRANQLIQGHTASNWEATVHSPNKPNTVSLAHRHPH